MCGLDLTSNVVLMTQKRTSGPTSKFIESTFSVRKSKVPLYTQLSNLKPFLFDEIIHFRNSVSSCVGIKSEVIKFLHSGHFRFK